MTAAMARVLLDRAARRSLWRISPLGLLPVPGALIFIWLGYRWKDRRPGLFFGAATLAAAALALIVMPPLNMRAGDLGWPLLGVAGAAAIVDRIAWIARRLPGRLHARSLGWIGRNSLDHHVRASAASRIIWRPISPSSCLLVLGVAGPLLIGALLRRNRTTRLLFLGREMKPVARTAGAAGRCASSKAWPRLADSGRVI